MAALELSTEYQLENALVKVLEEHKEQIDELFAKYGDREKDKAIYYRFLKAFEFDMKQADDYMSAAVKWKEEHNFWQMMENCKNMTTKDFPHADTIRRFSYEREDYCFDLSGNPVSFTRVALLDPVSYMGNITTEMLEEYTLHLFAVKIGMFSRLTQEKGFIVRGIRVWDMEGLSVGHFSSEMLRYLKGVVTPAQANFPEHMYKSFIINAPSMFSMAWALIKPFVPERSLKKITIMGSDYKDTLLKYIAEDQLPVQYGGTNAAPLWEDAESEFTKTLVPARGSIKLEKKIPQGSKLVWDFRTVYADVGFEVKFVAEDASKTTTKAVPYSRVESYKKIQKGEFVPSSSGTAFICFDNSYSLMTGKEIVYQVSVSQISPSEDETKL
eukprot:TRINITY_DN22755_c0_g1_i1.p1 TRINITY_DN22755_c0_g1~~TRINITY_DN22755_c0_g1_i1.p1  ORF type:complete len:384 (-),score=99.18 TRINITY_DN22755_c0_g1_i1:81-1232(-)